MVQGPMRKFAVGVSDDAWLEGLEKRFDALDGMLANAMLRVTVSAPEVARLAAERAIEDFARKYEERLARIEQAVFGIKI